MGIRTWPLVSVTLFDWRNSEVAFPLLSLERRENKLLGHSYMCVGCSTIFLWEGLICYVIHSLLSFELFDDASFYSCVLPQELDLNMLPLETW